MKKSTLILLICLAAALVLACTKQSLKTTYDKQTSYIESFVAAQLKADTNATLLRNEGAWRITLHDTLDRIYPDRDCLLWNGSVALYYACFTLTSSSLSASNLVATNLKEMAEAAKWKLSDSTNIFKLDTLKLNHDLVDGLRMGLYGVQPGDEGFILFTGEYGFGNTERGTIPARSALVYEFWIADVKNE